MTHQVCCCDWSKVTTYHGLRVHQGKMGCTPKGLSIPESEKYRYEEYFPRFTYVGPPIRVLDPLPDIFTPPIKPDTELRISRTAREESALSNTRPVYSTPVKKEPALEWTPPTLSIPSTHAVKETNNSLFETPPPPPPPPARSRQKASSICRVLDFHSGAEQTRQDRIRAELQQKIQMRQQKMAQVKSSVKVCKGSLDAEWLEINNVFSEVMRVVEDARQEALQPLEERRNRLKRDSRDVVQKLQNEIDKLKETISDLDRNPDLQVFHLDESQDWEDARVDTSFSFATLRSQTSYMMEQIHQELEKLSSVELQRISTFAVDVKLDPNSAHQCLVLSPDGKEVRDGGQNQKVPDLPGRFDMYGSVLGLNRLTSGKFYWEVEVSNKTGWDLGVARRGANRKGKLKLNPNNGYWVTVHYEKEKYAAMAAPPVSLSLTAKPQKVGVFVDYEEGLVSFYDVTARSHIYSFTGCSFSDDIFPYFRPHLTRDGKNWDPLIISAVKRQK